MSDPVTNVEIEDILSSIRRLVSEDSSPRPTRASTREAQRVDRLVLTPALRVQEDPKPKPAPKPEPKAVADLSSERLFDLDSSARASEAVEDPAPEPILLTNPQRDSVETDTADPEISTAATSSVAEEPSAPADVLDEARDEDDGAAAVPVFETRRGPSLLAQLVEEEMARALLEEQGGVWGLSDADSEDLTEEAEATHAGQPDAEADEVVADEEAFSHEETVEALEIDDTAALLETMLEELEAATSESGNTGTDPDRDAETHFEVADEDDAIDLTAALAEPEDDTPTTAAFARDEALERKIAALEALVRGRPEGTDPAEEAARPDWDDTVEADNGAAKEDAAEAETAEDAVAEVLALQPAPEAAPTDAPSDVVDSDMPEAKPAAELIEWEDHQSRRAPSRPPVEELDVETQVQAQAEPDAPADSVEASLPVLDEAMLREMVSDIVRQELQGVLGERITRNVRKLVRREIHRVMMTQDFD